MIQTQISVNATSTAEIPKALRDMADAFERSCGAPAGSCQHIIGTIGYAGTWVIKTEAKTKAKRYNLSEAADKALA